MTLILTLRMGVNVKYKYANGKALCNLPFVGNNNVCSIVTICEILTVEMRMTLILTIRMYPGEM